MDCTISFEKGILMKQYLLWSQIILLKLIFFFQSIMTADKTPNLQGWVFMKQFDEHKWKKKFLRIKNRLLYICDSENEDVSYLMIVYSKKDQSNIEQKERKVSAILYPQSILPEINNKQSRHI